MFLLRLIGHVGRRAYQRRFGLSHGVTLSAFVSVGALQTLKLHGQHGQWEMVIDPNKRGLTLC